MSASHYILGIALVCSSCGDSGEKKVSLEQTRAAIEVRDAWCDELRPVEITAESSIEGADRIGVRLTSDGTTGIEPFNGSGTFRPEKPTLTVDTASTVSACWPFSTVDTLSLTAPFSDHFYGYETGRAVGEKLSFQIKFQSSMALIRFFLQSDNLNDMLESLAIKGDAIINRAKYMPYAGQWIEISGEGKPVVLISDCLLNNGRNHDFYLIPCESASDIVLSAMVNGKEYVFETKLPPLAAGSMTQLNLMVGREGKLIPKSSWVDNERKTDLREIDAVDSVSVGNYLRKDGLIVAKRDTLTVAVVFQTDGRHGKAIAIEDTEGTYSFGHRTNSSSIIFPTIDGKLAEGVINDSSSPEDEMLIYKPGMPYPGDTAFGYKDGAELTSILFKGKGKDYESSMLSVISRQHASYIPTLGEMADAYYSIQPYAHNGLAGLIEPFTGEYLTCSESSEHNFYGIDMGKGVVMSNYSKQYAQLKLRLFYLF